MVTELDPAQQRRFAVRRAKAASRARRWLLGLLMRLPGTGGSDPGALLARFPDEALLPFRRHGLDPVPELGRLRDREPVSKLKMPFGFRGWLVTGYAESRAILAADPKTFSNDFGHMIGKVGIAAEDDPGGLGFADPPAHTRLRKMLAAQFTTRALAAREPQIRAAIDDALDEVEASVDANGVVDLQEHFALAIPSRVIMELLGVTAPTGPSSSGSVRPDSSTATASTPRSRPSRNRSSCSSRSSPASGSNRAGADLGDPAPVRRRGERRRAGRARRRRAHRRAWRPRSACSPRRGRAAATRPCSSACAPTMPTLPRSSTNCCATSPSCRSASRASSPRTSGRRQGDVRRRRRGLLALRRQPRPAAPAPDMDRVDPCRPAARTPGLRARAAPLCRRRARPGSSCGWPTRPWSGASRTCGSASSPDQLNYREVAFVYGLEELPVRLG